MRACEAFLFFLSVFGVRAQLINWEDVSVMEIQKRIVGGTSCQEIIQAFLDRIRRLEANPGLGAVITVNPKAIQDARVLDEQFTRTGRPVGSMHCVPLLPKDNIDVAGLPTTGGLNVLRNNIPNRSAPIVAALQTRGAVVVGKANMAPMAQDSAMTNSETGGLAKNPYDLTKSTYGSSGGNGAAGAGVYTVLGIGTDTSGSVVLPSAAANLVGLRPTMGKLGLEGMIAGNELQDTAGPMGRWVADVAAAMDGFDPSGALLTYPLYTSSNVLDLNGLSGMRIATLNMLTYGTFSLSIPGKGNFVYQTKGDARRLIDEAIGSMQQGGAILSNVSTTIEQAGPVLLPMIMMAPAVSVCKPRWLGKYFNSMTGQKPFNSFSQFKDSPQLPQKFRELYQRAWVNRSRCEETLNDFASKKQAFLAQLIEPMFQPNIDVVIYPTMNYFPETFQHVQEDAISGVVLAAASGYPSLNLPIGFSSPSPTAPQGLPLGLTLLGRPNREDQLLKAAFAYQMRFGQVNLPWTTTGGAVRPGTSTPSTFFTNRPNPSIPGLPLPGQTGIMDQFFKMISNFFNRLWGMISGSG